jgi:hypothetical protein
VLEKEGERGIGRIDTSRLQLVFVRGIFNCGLKGLLDRAWRIVTSQICLRFLTSMSCVHFERVSVNATSQLGRPTIVSLAYICGLFLKLYRLTLDGTLV